MAKDEYFEALRQGAGEPEEAGQIPMASPAGLAAYDAATAKQRALRSIGTVGMELERAMTDVIRLRAELMALIGDLK